MLALNPRYVAVSALICALIAGPLGYAQQEVFDAQRAHGQNTLVNPGFTDWNPDGGVPGWELNQEVPVAREAIPGEDGYELLLKLPESSDKVLRISQRLFPSRTHPDELVWFSVDVKVGIEDNVMLMVSTKHSDEDGKDNHRVHHHGGGWRTLEFFTQNTEGVAYFEMSIIIQKPTRNPVLIKNPSAVVLPVIP